MESREEAERRRRRIIDFALRKHLAGCPTKISVQDFIDWSNAGGAPDVERLAALREALSNMNAIEARALLFLPGTSVRRNADLAVLCGADASRMWNGMLTAMCPNLKVAEIPPSIAWDKDLVIDDMEPCALAG
ncbi:MAG: hypothetical protein OXH37_05270 [Gammaproteobacteria bacterium]|nr:hypothetical protein [Gammaproteobacteria bacterium]